MAAVQPGNVTRQCQPDPGTGSVPDVVRAVEREHCPVDLILFNAGAAVFNAQLNGTGLRAQENGHGPACWGIFNRVLQQVSAQFAQQDVIAFDHDRLLHTVVTQIDPFAPRLRQSGEAAVLHHLNQIHRRELTIALLSPLHRRKLQQPLGEYDSLIQRGVHCPQTLLPQSGITASKRDRHLCFKYRQWRFELVRCIRVETFLTRKHAAQTVDIAVKSHNQQPGLGPGQQLRQRCQQAGSRRTISEESWRIGRNTRRSIRAVSTSVSSTSSPCETRDEKSNWLAR